MAVVSNEGYVPTPNEIQEQLLIEERIKHQHQQAAEEYVPRLDYSHICYHYPCDHLLSFSLFLISFDQTTGEIFNWQLNCIIKN